MDENEIQMVRLLLPGAMPEPEPEDDDDIVRDKQDIDLSWGYLFSIYLLVYTYFRIFENS